MKQTLAETPTAGRKINDLEGVHCVRDAGVAGSNPATPTSFLSTYLADRDSYRDRNVPDYPPDPPLECERAALAGSPVSQNQFPYTQEF